LKGKPGLAREKGDSKNLNKRKLAFALAQHSLHEILLKYFLLLFSVILTHLLSLIKKKIVAAQIGSAFFSANLLIDLSLLNSLFGNEWMDGPSNDKIPTVLSPPYTEAGSHRA